LLGRRSAALLLIVHCAVAERGQTAARAQAIVNCANETRRWKDTIGAFGGLNVLPCIADPASEVSLTQPGFCS
jgi:hypothetical protein